MKNELKRAIISKSFFISVILLVVVLFPVLWEDLKYVIRTDNQMHDYISMFAYAMGVGPSFYAIALICAMPFSFSFADEWNTGYYKSAIMRSDMKKYINRKIFSVSIAGGSACALGVTIIVLICVIIFGSFQSNNQEVIGIISRSAFLPYMSSNIYVAGIQYVITRIFFAGLFGMVWSLFGLTVSAWIPNRYLALISPFVISFILLYIGYFTNTTWINPAYLINPTRSSLGDIIFAVPIYYLISFGANYLLFYYGIVRRYKNA